jgi:hypothetical protein
MRRTLQLLIAVACFAVVCGAGERHFSWPLRNWTMHLGERLGQTVYYISVPVIGREGPFHGDGPVTAAWNFAWRHVSWAIPALGGYAAAAGAFGALGRRTGAGRRPRDGQTRCGGCGYILRGVREPRCPECGRSI